MRCRWLLAVGLSLLNAALWKAPVGEVVLFPVAPPLTRIGALGDDALGTPPPRSGLVFAVTRVVQALGTAEQRRKAEALGPDRSAQERSRSLRLAVQADAIELAKLLGTERVGLIVAHRETLGEWYGEGRVWREALGD